MVILNGYFASFDSSGVNSHTGFGDVIDKQDVSQLYENDNHKLILVKRGRLGGISKMPASPSGVKLWRAMVSCVRGIERRTTIDNTSLQYDS
jgi:hypothetical protein